MRIDVGLMICALTGLVLVATLGSSARGASGTTARTVSSTTVAASESGGSPASSSTADWRIPPARPAPIQAEHRPRTSGVVSTTSSAPTLPARGGPSSSRLPSTSIALPNPTTSTTAQPAPPPATLAVGVTTIAPSVDVAIGRPVAPFGPVNDCLHPLAAIDRWPVRAKVAQLVMIGADGNDLSSLTALVRDQQIGGFLIRSAPSSASRLRADLDALAALAGPIPAFVAVDEEGGRVQPLRAIAGPLPSARRLARQEPAAIRETIGVHSKELRALGITMVLGPVADVTKSQSGVIGDRSFGGDPTSVGDAALAYANGVLDGGLLPVMKHFPGHGSASGDSHVGRVATPSIKDIEQTDIPPFRMVMAATPVAVMVGHLEVPGLSGDVPASLSAMAIEQELRTTLGFKGLVITDSLSMGAVTGRYRAPAAAADAIAAGADVALFVTISHRDAVGVIDALEQIVRDGRLTKVQLNRSVLRVVRSKGLDPCSVLPGDLVAVRPSVTVD